MWDLISGIGSAAILLSMPVALYYLIVRRQAADRRYDGTSNGSVLN